MTLRIGSSGPDVLSLQTNLNALGEQVRLTGVYDRATSDAVQRYQIRRRLQVDGLVTPALFRDIAERVGIPAEPLPSKCGDAQEAQGTGRYPWDNWSAVKRPGVQVVVTARNASAFLGRCLWSIEDAMKGLDWVLVFMDDGSTDQTYALAATFPLTAKRVVQRSEPAATIGEARNRALKAGKDYRQSHPMVYLLDADDVVLPAVVRLFDAMVASGHSAAFGDHQVLSTQLPGENRLVTAQAVCQLDGSIAVGAVAFHAALIPTNDRLFREDLPAHEDRALWADWFKAGIRLAPVPGFTVCKCAKRIGSVSHPQNDVQRADNERRWSELRLNIMDHVPRQPLVTALMLTGKCPEREALARVAVRCFLAQTWQNKQLVVVNHGTYSLANGDPRIKEIRVVKNEDFTLGDMRNRSIDEADGEWLVQWDDDDWHHPRRIEVQMACASPAALVTFLWQIRLNLLNGAAFYDRMNDGQHMSILFHRKVVYRYLPLDIREDTAFKRNFAKTIAIDNSIMNHHADPLMYVRTYHGRNIWDASHIMGGSEAKQDYRSKKEALVGYHVDRIRQIVREYREEPGYRDP